MKAGPREYNHYYRRWVWSLPFETDFQLPQGPLWVYNHQLQLWSFLDGFKRKHTLTEFISQQKVSEKGNEV